MATSSTCPNDNCIALARYPTSDPVQAALRTDSGAKRAAAAAAGPVVESFAAVATPSLQPDGLPFNRVTLVVNLDTQGEAIREYRKQLKQALATLEKAASAGEPSVEVLVQVPDQLTWARKPGLLTSGGTGGAAAGTTTAKGGKADKGGKGRKDKASSKEGKTSSKKKKKS